jgi:hypothetical protein
MVTTPDKHPLKHAIPFKQLAWLHNFFQNRFGERLSPNPCCEEGLYYIWLFEYLFTPFGLSNAAQTFQCMMDHVVSKLKAVFAYVDDSWICFPGTVGKPTSFI